MDLSTATPDELDAIEEAVRAERIRRQNQGLVEKRVHDVLAEARAGGLAPIPVPGAAWVQPTMAADAYMAGDVVTHDGQRWASTHDVNVHAPGVSGWRPVPEDGSAPAWVQPAGQHDAHRLGEVVTFEGAVWRSVIDWNVWSPAEYPRGWELVSDAEEPTDPAPVDPEDPDSDEGDEDSEPVPGDEPAEPDEPVDPDEGDPEDPAPEPEPEPASWVPDGHSYQAGDEFTYQGVAYRVLQAHTSQAHWTPDAAPALYERS